MPRKGSFCAFGGRSLLQRLQTLVQEIGGVCEAGDIEYVHRMRVASRRLRSALSVFRECIPDKRYSTWRREMRSITRALGDARDLDVQIAFLEVYLRELEQGRLRRGPERLLLRLRQKRAQAQGPVRAALDEFARSGIADEMTKCLAPGKGSGRSREPGPRDSRSYARAAEAVSSRMTEVLAFEPCVDRPENKEDLHAMRIANKRLRYVAEIFAPLYEDGLREELEAIRGFHTQLGDIHDCDVWEQFLPVFLEEERRRTLEFFGHCRFFCRVEAGIAALSENRRAFREDRYELFREHFHRSREEGFWGRFAQRLEVRADREKCDGGGRGFR